jgi:hypothetical protein
MSVFFHSSVSFTVIAQNVEFLVDQMIEKDIGLAPMIYRFTPHDLSLLLLGFVGPRKVNHSPIVP